MTTKKKYDVAIIGGGPAGCSSAYHAAKLGLSTILFEKKEYPRDKPCGGALSARNKPLLGEHTLAAINCEINKTFLFSPSFRFFSCGSIPGYFIIRETFDQAMAADARKAGAETLDNCPVTSITAGAGGDYSITTGQGSFTADYIILAGGMKNTGLLEQLGFDHQYEDDYLAVTIVSETSIDNRCMIQSALPDKSLAIFLGAVPNGYGWCFVKDGFINIGIGATAKLIKQSNFTPKTTYHHFVETLRKKNFIPQNLQLETEKGFPLPFKRTVQHSVSGKALLAGDLAGFVSPVTGEGLYYAIKSGQLAAQAIQGHRAEGIPLDSYQANWTKEFGTDINRYGAFLQKFLYQSRERMESIVALGRCDRKMSTILNHMIMGLSGYRHTIMKAASRLPITLLKRCFTSPTR